MESVFDILAGTNFQMYKEVSIERNPSDKRISEIFNLKARTSLDLINLKDFITIMTIGCRNDGSIIDHKRRCDLMLAIHSTIDKY